MSVRDGYKVLTHDGRPPIQGGDPVWDGKRATLDKVSLDTGPDECAAGWNYCADAATALRIAGLWPDGMPSMLLRVRGSADAVERGDKRRCSRLKIVGVCDEREVGVAVREMSEVFGAHADRMADSQMLWRAALARPVREEPAVADGLAAALSARGLDWNLRRYEAAWSARAAWAARAARDARDARAARDARDAWSAWSARDARDARDAWDARDARAARAARDARDARAAWAARAARAAWSARAAWDARDARAAWSALTVEYAALRKWIDHDPLLLTTGLRDAYRNGLAIVVPTGKNELGWAMCDA